MTDQPRWKEQCDAARVIRERFGTEKALGYLLGEKFLTHLRAAGRDPAFRAATAAFAAEIKAVFEPREIREYLSGVRRLGPLGHIMSQEEFETFRAAGAVDEDVVSAAQDAILLEQMKNLLLGGR